MNDLSGNTDKRIAVLISGRGSNMQAIHRACLDGSINATIVNVLSNNPDAAGLEYAEQNDLTTTVVDHRDYTDKAAFDETLVNSIDPYQPDIVALAGFMRVLSAEFTNHYAGQLLNIHPSLLPRHRGLDTHHKALTCGDSWHGCSVHFVSPALDGGPLIARSIVPVLPGDTTERLADRVLKKEHILFPKIISGCLHGDFSCKNGSVIYHGARLRYPLTV